MLHPFGLVLYTWGYYREEQVNTQMVGDYDSLHTILTGWAPLRAQWLQGRWGALGRQMEGGNWWQGLSGCGATSRALLWPESFFLVVKLPGRDLWPWVSVEAPYLADEGVQGKPPCIYALQVPPAQDSQYIWNRAGPYGPCRAPPHSMAMSSTCLLSAEKL